MRVLNRLIAIGAISVALASCGEANKEEAIVDADAPDVRQEVIDYYAAKPDFFTFATPADLPEGLTWENGLDEPELGSPNAKKGGTQFIRLQDFPRTLRKAGPDANGVFRRYILDYMSVPFAKQHPNTEAFFPGIAEEWAISKETKTVYVRINPDAKWSDGEPITADDMLFMFFFFQSEYIVAPWYNNWYSTQYTNVTKYDDLTFSVSVPKAKPDFASQVLELTPKPEHFFKEMGTDYVERYQWRFEPTSSAYTLDDKDIKKGQSITLRRNDDWWLKDRKFFKHRYNPDKLYFTVIRDVSKTFEALKRGDIDHMAMNVAEYWYDKLPDSDPDVAAGYIHKSQFYNVMPRPMFGLYINTARPQLDDLNIRLGIQHASNWHLVIEKFFRGDYARMDTFWEGFGKYNDPTIKAREFDIPLALEYFAKAGYTTRGPDGILVNAEGQKLSFTLTTGYEDRKDVLTILKEEAAKAGLEFRLEVLDRTAAWKKAQEKKTDIMFSAFGPSFEIFPRFWEFYHSDNAYIDPYLEDGSINPDRKLKPQTNNFFSYGKRDTDEWITTYRESEDADEKLVLAHKLQQRLHEEAIFVPGWVQGFYRDAHWRWMKYPEDFNVMHSEDQEEYFVHWIDEDLRKETKAARKDGTTFPPEVNVYTKYKE
jgi:microcin C transport system substrate-binding protein